MAEKCSQGNFCIAFLACIHMDAHGHTAILSVVWLPSSRCCSHGEWWIEGPITEPQRSAQAQAMWYVETAGSAETPPLSTTSSLFIPGKTERGRIWQLTMKSWQSISPWWCQIWAHGFVKGWCVFVRACIWERVRAHMANHVNESASQLTKRPFVLTTGDNFYSPHVYVFIKYSFH